MTVTVNIDAELFDRLQRVANDNGQSVEELITALAKREVAISEETRAFFEERRARADLEWFNRFLNREGGAEPAPEDRLD